MTRENFTLLVCHSFRQEAQGALCGSLGILEPCIKILIFDRILIGYLHSCSIEKPRYFLIRKFVSRIKVGAFR